MKRLVLKYADTAFLLVLGLLPLLWFRPGYDVLAGFDFAVYFDPPGALSKSWYLWSDLMAGGYDISHEVSSAPYYLLFSLPLLAGGTLYGAEKFVFCVLFALQGLSMSYMLNALFGHRAERGGIALTGAVLYSLSFPVMAHFGRGNLMALLTYGLLPFLIGMLHRGFNSTDGGNKYVASIALLSLPIAATKGHPADFVVLTLVAALFTLFHALNAGREGAQRAIVFASKALTASVLVNLWWIAPNIRYMADFGLTRSDLVKEGFYNLDTLGYYSSGKSILKILQNNSLDLWFNVPADAALNASVYSSPLFSAAGLLTPLAGAAALLRRRIEANTIFFSSVFIAAVFMAKGSHPPLGRAFEGLYMNIPGFFLFRAPYRVFSSLIAFSLAPLAAALAGPALWRLLKKKESGEPFLLGRGSLSYISGGAVLSVFFAAAALYSWPLFTGSHLRERGTLREPGVFHSMPKDYALAGRWLEEEGGRSKLYIPYEVYDSNARWGYSGPDPSYELITAPKVAARPNGTVYLRYQRPIERLNGVVRDWSYGDLKKVLALYNIGHVMVNGHLSPWALDDPNFNEYLEGLLRENGFNPKKKWGGLSFYENPGHPGRVYAAKKAYLVSGDETALPALSVAGYLEKPFLVMARDVSLDGLGGLLKSFDGALFYNSNLTDLICESALARYGAEQKGEGFIFRTERGFDYEVYAKVGAGSASVGGEPLERTAAAYDGFSWKVLGGVRAGSEAHTISIKGAARGVVVIPRALADEIRGAFHKESSKDGFEAAFIFDGSLRESGEITLEGAYEAMTLKPKKLGRVETDALSGARWARTGNAYTAKSDVEIGKYPMLSIEGSDKKKLSSVALSFSVDKSGGLERLELYPDVLSGGDLDIASILRKKFPEASLFTLRYIRATYSPPQDKERPGLRLLGRLGVESHCPEGKAAMKVGDREFGSDYCYCDRWAGHPPLSPGRYRVEALGDGGTPVLLLRKGRAGYKAASDVNYERIDPSRYDIDGPPGKLKLVFGDSYNEGWTLKGGDRSYKPVKVNGYANGFLAEMHAGGLTLEYSPQRLFDLSKIISATSLAAVALLGFFSIKR